MGTSRNSAQFVRKIHQAAEATERHNREAVEAGAFEAKKAMLAAAATKGLTPGSKIAGGKWNVRYDVKGKTRPVALVRYTGPVHLVHNPTKPHYIAAKGLGGSRGSRGERAFQASASRFLGGSGRGAFSGQRRSKGRKALKLGNGFAAYVFHPGTRGKPFFPIARVVAARTVPAAMAKSMKGAWRRVLT